MEETCFLSMSYTQMGHLQINPTTIRGHFQHAARSHHEGQGGNFLICLRWRGQVKKHVPKWHSQSIGSELDTVDTETWGFEKHSEFWPAYAQRFHPIHATSSYFLIDPPSCLAGNSCRWPELRSLAKVEAVGWF